MLQYLSPYRPGVHLALWNQWYLQSSCYLNTGTSSHLLETWGSHFCGRPVRTIICTLSTTNFPADSITNCRTQSWQAWNSAPEKEIEAILCSQFSLEPCNTKQPKQKCCWARVPLLPANSQDNRDGWQADYVLLPSFHYCFMSSHFCSCSFWKQHCCIFSL